MVRTTFAAAAFALLASIVPVSAADREKGTDELPAATAVAAAGDVDWSLEPVRFGAAPRGALLPSLYASLGALNAFDAYTTTKGLSLGAAEANPMMRAVAGRPALLWAVKGGVTVGSALIAERLWRNNSKAGAIAVMVIANGMMATVAAKNARVIGSLR